MDSGDAHAASERIPWDCEMGRGKLPGRVGTLYWTMRSKDAPRRKGNTAPCVSDERSSKWTNMNARYRHMRNSLGLLMNPLPKRFPVEPQVMSCELPGYLQLVTPLPEEGNRVFASISSRLQMKPSPAAIPTPCTTSCTWMRCTSSSSPGVSCYGLS